MLHEEHVLRSSKKQREPDSTHIMSPIVRIKQNDIPGKVFAEKGKAKKSKAKSKKSD